MRLLIVLHLIMMMGKEGFRVQEGLQTGDILKKERLREKGRRRDIATDLVHFLVISKLLKETKTDRKRHAKGFKSVEDCQIVCHLGPVY